jgi:outer membrane protein TolC
MKPLLTLFCLLLLALTSPAGAAEATNAPASPATTNVLTLSWLLSQVRSNNASLKSVRAAWEAMEARIRPARAWEDPIVGVDLERNTTQFADINDLEWTVAQEIPISGKNRLRGKIATAQAAVAQTEWQRRDLDLTTRARVAFHRFANGYAQLALNRQNENLLRSVVEISRDKYALGKRTQSDVLMAETDLARVTEQRRDIEREILEVQSVLNTLMNHMPQETLPPPAPLLFRDIALDLSRLQEMALEHRPNLRGLQKKIEAAEGQISLARRAWIPDPEIRLEARQYDGIGGGFQEYDTGIFFKIPWFNQGKYRGAISEARRNAESAAYELTALQSETLGMVRDQVTKIETFHHHYLIFKDRIVPLAGQTVDATQIAYSTDKATILELLAAQRSFQEAESTLQHHLTEYLNAIADLEAMIGEPVLRDSDRFKTPEKFIP